MEAPECPVCNNAMTVPIFQCQSGHSVCFTCKKKLTVPICPLCRQIMTQMRNWQLEELVAQSITTCPNKTIGCVIKLKKKEMEEHLKECIFRTLDCPVGKIFGTCSWSGKHKDLMNHFKVCHPQNCDIKPGSDIRIQNISTTSDHRLLYLFEQNKKGFILSFKIDTVQKHAYWLVQYLGSNCASRQNIYEIHITSLQNKNRKVVFADHCFSDSMDVDDVFRQAKCAVMPLIMLNQFIENSKLVFQCLLKRTGSEPKPSVSYTPNPMKGRSKSYTRHKPPHDQPKQNNFKPFIPQGK
ncbi:E3 ubiquitin-protein ligase SIAH1A-like isoform X2 [Zerene cesonia]|nr:E3 ubiquitin-protein ligase SIAH1A-like isoform X2 [Zerene cesonia]XP_038212265.1 E3 ubiquitin-protein ligase SIAH1A-like isoform X2 [Zerene cesonia]XP_038212266.1 E3 ubiquitin-protein ligase SIAH1A-like isoform X2 [Zerene cesonia]XP_038212267.1 E3 ubiquitin-protein ligase SIAH1A-like isoform X2 [Zerene cesonia]